MKKTKFLVSMCLVVSMGLFTIAPAFADLGDLPPTPTPPPAIDLCPNITGTQDVIPSGMIVDGSGNCITPIPADTTAPVISGVLNTSVSSIAATIVWTTDDLSISGLEYGTTSGYGSSATLPATALLAHTVVLTGLTSGTTYYYCIHATNLASLTGNSCGHSFTTEPATDATPPVVTLIATTSVSPTQTTVTWTTDEAANSQVEYGLSSNYSSSTTLDSSLTTTHSATISGLTADTEYHFRIKSIDNSSNTVTSGDNTFTTVAVVSSGSSGSSGSSSSSAPSITLPVVSAVNEATDSPTSETITWVTDLPADSQIVYGTTSSYGASTSLSTTLVNNHSVSLTNLTPNTTYHYQIKTKTAAGNYAVTTDENFTTLSAEITAPTITLVASSVTSNSATVTWTTDVPANSQVQYGLNSAYDNQTTLNANLTTSHSVTISNLAPNTTYEYRVASENALNDLSLSVNHTFTTASVNGQSNSNSSPAEILPNIITNLRVSDIESSAVTLNFTVPNTPTNEALQYDIRFSTSPITNYNFNSATPVQDTAIYYDFPALGASVEDYYIVLQLNSATKYYFAIKTKDQVGNTSPVSDVVSATTLSASSGSQPSSNSGGQASGSAGSGGNGGGSSSGGSIIVSPPKHIRAEALDASTAISWTNPTETNFVRVKVLRKTTGYPTSLTDGQAIYEGNNFHYNDINLTNGKTYYYSIFSLNHLSHISAPVQFSVTPKAGVEQENLIDAPSAPTVSCGQDLSFGMRGDAVRQLQQYLDKLDSVAYPPNLISGYFYTYTRTAIKQLQSKYGLPQTGNWDAAIRAAVGMCFSAPAPASTRDLQIGMNGSDIKILQQYLVNLKLLDPKYLTGYFGKFTKAAVVQFQQSNNIQPSNGVVGSATRNLIPNN